MPKPRVRHLRAVPPRPDPVERGESIGPRAILFFLCFLGATAPAWVPFALAFFR